MAILAFQKPEKVIMLESTSSFGKFEFRPLEPGFGMTIGNALRRILLSSLEGYAITTVKVAGVDHEFAAIPGVMDPESQKDPLRPHGRQSRCREGIGQRGGGDGADRRIHFELSFILQGVEPRVGHLPSRTRNQDADHPYDR